MPKFDGECNLYGKKGYKKYDCWNNDRNKDKRPKHWRVPRKHDHANDAGESSEDEAEIYTMWTMQSHKTLLQIKTDFEPESNHLTFPG
jgi:hypothetical protein